MKNILFLISILFLIISINSCQLKTKYPKDVLLAIEKSGDNKQELEILIKHYSKPEDSLKLKAAFFLIANMEGQSYYSTKIVDTAGNTVNFDVLSYPNYDIMRSAWDSLETQIGSIDFTRDTTIYDLETISSNYLIQNIDLSFEAWQNPWAQQLTFIEFCEYILPYRASNEPLEAWRPKLKKRYQWLTDSMAGSNDPIKAAILINKELRGWYKFDPIFYRHPTDLGLDEMLDRKKGRCEDMTNLAIYAMRSQGVAVMSDYTPAWPNTGNNHAWNATLTLDKEVVIFMGGERDPYKYVLNNKKAKVYRKTFSQQKTSLALTAPEYEKIPGWLKRSHYMDVTNSYIETANPKLNS